MEISVTKTRLHMIGIYGAVLLYPKLNFKDPDFFFFKGLSVEKEICWLK